MMEWMKGRDRVTDLILAFLCSGSISLVFKFSENRDYNRYGVTTFNYLVASILGIGMARGIAFEGFESFGLTLARFLKGSSMDAPTSLTWAVSTGVVTGILFVLTFLVYQVNVRRYGPSVSGMFGKLGILVPMLLSVWLFREFPGAMQLLGIGLSFFAILLMNLGDDFRWEVKGLLILFFFLGGAAEFMNKIFQMYARAEFRPAFLCVVFVTALLVSLIGSLPHLRRIGWREAMVGLAVGIPNFFSSYFLIGALRTLPTAVVFPVYGAGSILVMVAGSRWLFGETMGLRKRIAALLTILALILINI